jgi:hypothetical protein
MDNSVASAQAKLSKWSSFDVNRNLYLIVGFLLCVRIPDPGETWVLLIVIFSPMDCIANITWGNSTSPMEIRDVRSLSSGVAWLY